MTNKEFQILTKAVLIAKDNGFKISDDFFISVDVQDKYLSNRHEYLNIIFNHTFAKNFWGEDLVQISHEHLLEKQEAPYEVDLVETVESGGYPIAGLISCNNTIQLPQWQYHIGQMVYRNNPIDYIDEAMRGVLDEDDEPIG